MKCVEVKEHLETFLDGETGVIWRDEIETHLETCESCRAEFAELRSVSRLLRKELPVSAPNHLDAKVFAAFRQHHEKKSVWNWSAILASIFAPKPIFALLTLGILTGLAFLVGRMTAPANEIIVASPSQIVEKEVPKEVIKYIEVPTTKIVEIPIEREKIVTQIVYRNVEMKRKSLSPTLRAGNSPNKNSESVEQVDLKDFQPLGEISPKILKKGETNEK
jgi:hypothetical protein